MSEELTEMDQPVTPVAEETVTPAKKVVKRARKKAAAPKAEKEESESFPEADSAERNEKTGSEESSSFDGGSSDENGGGLVYSSDSDQPPVGVAGEEERKESDRGGPSHFRQQSRGNDGNRQGNNGGNPRNNRKKKKRGKAERPGGAARRHTPFTAGEVPVEVDPHLELGQLANDELLQRHASLEESFTQLFDTEKDAIAFNPFYDLPLQELRERGREMELDLENAPARPQILEKMLKKFEQERQPILVEGCLEVLDEGFGMVVFAEDSYRLKPLCPFVSEALIEHHGLQRGHTVEVLVQAPREGESCPIALRVKSVMGGAIEDLEKLTPFTELTPYYPLDRILLENSDEDPENNLSMRVVDLITPIGFGQRGLIVAPPRTGKTVLLQGVANSVQLNYPEAHLIVLLIDERPEEVTDFRRRVKGEVISSTFDETAGSHVHAAEMVIEKARRMVEVGRDVVILLDSITRLARAYNTLMPNSGKILSGGVEANALQKPKRFFGSARNIEDGGSITIMGTALVETGSKMDEVIFEEFKGTGNMELHLDRGLVDKRIFPALAMDRSGTRKEELLYHPDEMMKVYSLRRATKGVPPIEAMEMLITRVKKTRSNAEFLMTLSR
ncbi:MAG: transcription termination factor Rho [Verrucomicrobiota bacterium]